MLLLLDGSIYEITPPVMLDAEQKGLIGAGILIICGAIGAIMLARFFGQRLHCKTPVEAEIMYNDKSAGKHGALYAPEYSYHYNDRHYTFQSHAYTHDAYEIGQKVTVYINPNAPETCLDKQKTSRVRLWTGLVFELLAAVGAALLLLALLNP